VSTSVTVYSVAVKLCHGDKITLSAFHFSCSCYTISPLVRADAENAFSTCLAWLEQQEESTTNESAATCKLQSLATKRNLVL